MSKMPELPEASWYEGGSYTAQQMHDYARAYAESEAGRLREVLDCVWPALRNWQIAYPEHCDALDERAAQMVAALAPKEK